ncbi:MAG: ABC transporter ATP-binding protein [Pirellula sp.]
MENIVEVSQLTKRYRSFAALNDCNLSITQGTVFGLLGPNGAGKTTMIRCLMGYLKPTSGTAVVDGLNCHSHSLQVRQRVSYLPAESKLFRLMKGSDCIEFFASIHPRGNKTLALAIARRLELDTTRRVAFMSTGMRQKLAISCVMSCHSRLMILDEPTANLDPTVRSEVLQLVREAKERGTTIAFCSHVLEEIEQICDKAAILKQGKVVVTIDLRELRFVHRIQGAITRNSPLKLRDDHVRIIDQDEARIVMEIDGPLDNHLEWLSKSGLQSIQIESVGLKGVYERFHPGFVPSLASSLMLPASSV